MNGVTGARMSLPATAVLRLTGDRPMTIPPTRNAEADEALLAAVTHPPRVGDVRPIAALMPDVLARYGLTKGSTNCEAVCECALDCYA